MNEPPDVVLLGAAWQPRALIRAQLIEEGLEVVATDSWPMMRRHLRPGMKPRLAFVDLKELQNPEEVLDGLRVLMKPECVLLLSASGAVPATDPRGFGFRIRSRPVSVQEIVATIVEMIRAAEAAQP